MSEPNTDRLKEIEEVTVVGHRPGPRLWKIRKNDTTSWIFAYISTVTKDLDWDSTYVEEILDEVDWYIPNLRATVPFTIHKDLRNNSGNEKLVDLLPEPILEKYQALQNKYFKFLSVRKRRPFLAESMIRFYMTDDFNLRNARKIIKKVDRLARKHDIPVLEIDTGASTELKEKVANTINSILSNITLEREMECFSQTLDNVEEDFETMRNKAVAWGNGYVEELSYYYDEEELKEQNRCSLSLEGYAVSDEIDRYVKDVSDQLVAAVDTAHTNRESVFIVMNISKIIDDKYLLESMEKAGFTITSPLEQ